MTDTPEPDGGVALELLDGSVAAGGAVHYALINDGHTAILTGGAYELERQTKDGWDAVPLNMWFALVGIIIEPGQRRDLSAPIPRHVSPGSYRIRETLKSGLRCGSGWDWHSPAAPTVDVTAELQITAS